jgi:hypothetical protein
MTFGTQHTASAPAELATVPRPLTKEEAAEYEDFRSLRAAGFRGSKERLAQRRVSARGQQPGEEALERVSVFLEPHVSILIPKNHPALRDHRDAERLATNIRMSLLKGVDRARRAQEERPDATPRPLPGRKTET